MNSSKSPNRAAVGTAWALLSGAAWGLDGIVLGAALALAPFAGAGWAAPLAAAAFHDGAAAVALLLFNLVTGRLGALRRALATREGAIVCLAALLGGPIGMSGYLLAVKNAGPACAMTVTALYPAVAALLARAFLGEKISAGVWAGIALSATGAAVIGYAPSAGAPPGFTAGVAFALVAALGWGGEAVASAGAMRKLDPAVAINIRELTSFAVYAAVALPIAGAFGVFTASAVSEAARPLAVAGVIGGVSFLAWYRGMSLAGVARTMPMNATYALWGVVFAAAFSASLPDARTAAGAALVTAGAAIVTMRRGKANSKPRITRTENHK